MFTVLKPLLIMGKQYAVGDAYDGADLEPRRLDLLISQKRLAPRVEPKRGPGRPPNPRP